MTERFFATLEEKVDPAHTALLLVDFQNDFCSQEGGAGQRGADLSSARAAAERTQGLLAAARAAGVRVVFIRAVYDEIYLSGPQLEVKARRNGALLCQSNTWGVELFGFEPQAGEFVVNKHRYSAFLGTDLEQILHASGVQTVVVTGVTTHVCVESTVRDAFFRNYYVVVPADCVAASNDQIHEASLTNMDAYYAQVVGAADVIGVWRRVPAGAGRSR